MTGVKSLLVAVWWSSLPNADRLSSVFGISNLLESSPLTVVKSNLVVSDGMVGRKNGADFGAFGGDFGLFLNRITSMFNRFCHLNNVKENIYIPS